MNQKNRIQFEERHFLRRRNPETKFFRGQVFPTRPGASTRQFPGFRKPQKMRGAISRSSNHFEKFIFAGCLGNILLEFCFNLQNQKERRVFDKKKLEMIFQFQNAKNVV